MKFYDRKEEMAALKRIEAASSENAQLTVITGRRRIGKTTLVKNALTELPLLYFFVGKKSEALLCAELKEIVYDVLGEDLGEFSSFPRLLTVLMRLSRRTNFTLVLDEFQNLRHVNDSLFADIQNVWDSEKEGSHINLVICGSIYSKMRKIFEDKNEPLYGRATARMKIRPFKLETMREILQDHNPSYTQDDLLAMYMITGGVAKYVEQLVMYRALTRQTMLDYIFSTSSYFINEGTELLSDEFGREYGNYFSILAALSDGHTTRGDIKSYTGVEAGGFLDKLEKDFDIVSRKRPYLSGDNSKNVRYEISDCFLNFWFRFFYKYRSAVEIGNLEYVRAKAVESYETASGFALERLYRQMYVETGQYNIVAGYWKSDGKDEIDLVAVNENDRIVVVGECKRNPGKYSANLLKEKAAKIQAHHKGWKIEFKCLTLEDIRALI